MGKTVGTSLEFLLIYTSRSTFLYSARPWSMAQKPQGNPTTQTISTESSDPTLVQSRFFMETEVYAIHRSLRLAAPSPLNIPGAPGHDN